MNNPMRAAVMDRPGSIVLEEREMPRLRNGDALIRVAYVGICGSDMALFQHGRIGESVVDGPMVLGHEASGTVVRVGRGVSHLQPGDRVAMEPGVPCLTCEFCRGGRYNICPNVHFWASLPVTEGALQEYVRHPASFCHKLPDSVGLLEGALIEPLSVAIHAVRRSGAAVGDSAVVLGAGSVGLLTAMTLLAAGATSVVAADLAANRLRLALRVGAEPLDASTSPDLVDELRRRFGHGPDMVFETAGTGTTMAQSVRIAKPGGTVVLVGYTKSGRAELPVNTLIDKELTVRTVFRYRDIYPQAIAAVASGAIPVAEVVSAVYPFGDAQKAMENAIHRKDDVAKCVIKIQPEERP